jgi:Holliday junction resolvase RusA-like endonuclease
VIAKITITLPGAPQGKGRPRFVRSTGHVYTPAETRKYEAALRRRAMSVIGSMCPLEGPLAVTVEAFFPIPESWSNRKATAALHGAIRPTGRPDVDNIAKVLDAFNGLVWVDDKQIVDARVVKVYSDTPCLRVTVTPLGPALFDVKPIESVAAA